MSEFRKGTCADCKAEFKIPADFPHDRAKCRQCGGTVSIAAAGAADETASEAPKPKPVPAAKPPAPKPKAAPKPRPKPIAKAKAKPIAKPKAKPVVKPKAAPAPKPEKAEAEPAEKPMTMKEKIMARKAAEAAAAGSGPEAPAAKAAPKKAAAPKAKAKAADKPKSKRAAGKSGSRSGSKRGKRDDKTEETGGKRERRAKPEKKAAPMGGLIAIAALVVGGGAAWYFMAGPGSKGDAPKTTEVATNDEGTAKDAEPAETTPEVDETPVEAPKAEEPKEVVKKEAAPKKPPVYKPMDVVYDEIPVFGPAVGTTDEEWADLQEWAATAADMDAARQQTKAAKRLTNVGYKAMPAILNEFRKVDLSTDVGYRLGDFLQRQITIILNGMNVTWDGERGDDYVPTKRAHMVNRKAVLVYLKTWNKISEDPTEWIGTAKLGQEKYHGQLVAYSAILHAAGITDGALFSYVLDEDGGSQEQAEDDLDDF